MPISVFGNSSHDIDKIDTSLIVQKHYLRTSYIEAQIEEDIDLKITTEVKIYLVLLVLGKLVAKITLIICSTMLLH